MKKNLVILGSSSELAIELISLLDTDEFNVYTVSTNRSSYPNLLIKNYYDENEKISLYISEIENPYILFFNGYLKENRPNYFPNAEEVLNTFKINFEIPLLLTSKIINYNKNAKFIYISTMAAVKFRYKNYYYGYSKKLLEKSIVDLKVEHLFFRFGKIKTKMSKEHSDPPFTLTKNIAANFIANNIDKKGIVYPTIGLKLVAAVLKFTPITLLNNFEKKFIKKVNY